MVTEDKVDLALNAPFEEIGKDWYMQYLECVPPIRLSSPYRNGGWFFMGEAYTHDWGTGLACHYLCFHYSGKYYAGLRRIDMSYQDIENEIGAFCRQIDAEQI